MSDYITSQLDKLVYEDRRLTCWYLERGLYFVELDDGFTYLGEDEVFGLTIQDIRSRIKKIEVKNG